TCSRPTDLIKIRFTSPKAGWIVGERGSILRTTDAGFTWVDQKNGTKASLFGLSFPDPNHGWASGERGTILHLKARP
ncbi:MAG: WD40/YVTN/BNR-like repeat-containing protein, partial [Nitrospiraceae bacterium]